jgi:DNA repair photolyase
MPAIAKVDETGKVTVSLGGSCALRCKHCYITAPSFSFNRNFSVDEVMGALHQLIDRFDTVCISGDTDPLLREGDFLRFLERVVQEIRPQNLMFTTRLIPSPQAFDVIRDLAITMQSRRRFFVPCVSFVSPRYPNGIEDHSRVPSPIARADLMERFREIGAPAFAAFRPTFPFEIVPSADVDALVQLVQSAATCILGEVFLLDEEGAIAARLGMPAGAEIPGGQELTFLDQGRKWQKRFFPEEVEYVRSVAAAAGIPFFLRSMSAIRLLEQSWDFDLNQLSSNLEIPSSGCYDHLSP